MTTAKVFISGNSQAIRLPKEFRVQVSRLEIFRRGKEIILREPEIGLTRALDILAEIPADFFAEGRRDDPPQSREKL